MKITNKIKAQVFGQYLGQVAQWKNLDYTDKYETETMWDNVTYYIDNNAYLILKPLSSISDEDAIELIKLHGKTENPSYVKQSFIEKSQPFIRNWVMNNVMNYQFLQALGYDLPNFFLQGKTLHECNLAIYE